MGTQMVLAARRKEKLEQVAADVRQKYPSTRIVVVPTDVGKVADCERLVEKALEHFDRCDILINNAAIPGLMHFESASAERVEEVIDINLKGTMQLARCIVPSMMKAGRGHIVNIASLSGKGVEPYNCIYDASKFGVVGFSHGLRAEMRVKNSGVTVHCICPGFISDAGMAADPSKNLKIDRIFQDAMKAGGS